MKNGAGLRVVLWVAGCSHGCRGCQNPITWDVNGGLPFTDTEKQEIFGELEKEHTSGITFSGGDPLHPANLPEVTALAEEIKKRFPGKTIWLYTGYLWEEINDKKIVRYLDVLADGEYQEANRALKLHWVGSTNQRVIDVPATLKKGQVVLYKDE